MSAEVEATGADLLTLLQLLECFVHENDPCCFDHHGGCQSHGFLSLEPGERCPHAEAVDVIKRHRKK